MKTVELMEKYCPGIQEEILSGKLKLSQRELLSVELPRKHCPPLYQHGERKS